MILKFIKRAGFLIFILILTSCTQKSPLEKAERIAERIINETMFETEKVEIEPTDQIQVIDFNIVFGEDINGICLAKNIITSPKDTTLWFGVSYSIPFLILLNNEVVHEQTEDAEFNFREKAYGMYEFQNKFSLKLKAVKTK